LFRRVDECPYRTNVRELPGGEFSECELVECWFPRGAGAAPIPRAICEQCTRSAPPDLDRLNDVIASQVYRRAARLWSSSEPLGCDQADILRARAAAARALKIIWTTPNSHRWTGAAHTPQSTSEVIDPAINADTFAGHLKSREPFAYLRYGDGEWYSILGRLGHNGDGHDFFPETLGVELSETFQYVARLWPRNELMYMGLNAFVVQDAIRRYLVEHDLAYRIHWVCDNLFALGYRDFSTRRFLEAVRDFCGPKVLAGNEALAPVASGLGCRHVVVPRINCYQRIKRLHGECRFAGPGLLICCAGMASECLICRVHSENPEGSYVDCGHIFDALVGNLSRPDTQGNWGGILDFLGEHYAPLVLGSYPSRSGHS
jgi:hypothetical protein